MIRIFLKNKTYVETDSLDIVDVESAMMHRIGQHRGDKNTRAGGTMLRVDSDRNGKRVSIVIDFITHVEEVLG